MSLIDTSYWLAVAKGRDALHQRARLWSDALNEPLLVTEYVLWETVNALSAPIDRPKAYAIASTVRSAGYSFVSASDELLLAGLELHHDRPDKFWSLTDCISFIIMQQRGITRALTYDCHFEQAGFEALLRRDP